MSGDEPEPTSHAPTATRVAADEERAAPPAQGTRSWGWPAFATTFPRHPELDALVEAFALGNYAAVRSRAPKLAETTTDEAVARAARLLRERIEPDPTAKLLLLVTAALLVLLTAWWIAHDGPEGHGTPNGRESPKTQPER